jgi:hypothetical protein
LSRLATSFVLGYHGCDRTVAAKAVFGDVDILQSTRNFDWLGHGAYFWESDPYRALEWAKEHRRKYPDPCVIGAVIDLRNCLDLTNRNDLEKLKLAHTSYENEQKLAGLALPENESLPNKPDEDRLLRYLDCAVIKHLHSIIEKQPQMPNRLDPYDTVRGMFTEGGNLYPGAGFKEKSHTQVAVINPACIVGLFYPRADATDIN